MSSDGAHQTGSGYHIWTSWADAPHDGHAPDLLAHRVRVGGFCHLATDWAPYAEWMVEMFSQTTAWHNTSENGDFVPQPARRPITKFETRGERLGHEVFDLVYERKASDQHL